MPSLTKVQTGFLEPQGPFTLDVGTASAPGLFFSGSSFTGLYSPGENQLGITINQTPRLVFDSSGTALFGGMTTARSNFDNSTGTALLQIEGTSEGGARSAAIISAAESGGAGSRLILAHQKSGTVGGNTILGAGDQIGVLVFQGSNGTEFVAAASIQAFVDDTPGTDAMPGRLVLSTTASGSNTQTERVRITNTGNVGIGTTNPSSELHVVGTVTATGVISPALGTAAAPSIAFTGDTNTGIFSPGADQVAVATNGVGRLFINETGQVGIGVSGSGIEGALSTNDAVVVRKNTDGWIFKTERTDNSQECGFQSVGHSAAVGIAAFTNNTERARITFAGNVGIGTTSPGGLLETSRNASDTLAGEVLLQRIRSNAGSNNVFVDIKSRRHTTGSDWTGVGFRLQHQVDSTQMGFIEFNSIDNSRNLVLGTGGSPRLLITNTGNVGIGTTNPVDKLQVIGGIRLSENLTVDGNTNSRLQVRAGNVETLYNFEAPEVTTADVGFRFFRTTNTTGAKYVAFLRGNNTTNTSAVIAVDGGTSYFNAHGGNVGIGTQSPSSLLEVLLGDSGEARFSRFSTSQYASISSTAAANIFNSFSASNNAKALLINSTTNSSNTTPTSGSVGINLRVLSTDVMLVRSTLVVPGGNGTIDLGSSTARWKDIYATNTTIQTSDRNLKTDIQACDLGINFINQLLPVSFKQIDGTSGRKHYGLIAQDVEEVLNGSDAAFLIKSPVIEEKTVQITNPETGELEDSIETVDTGEVVYGLRYGELIAPMIKAIQQLTEENKSLLARIEALENS